MERPNGCLLTPALVTMLQTAVDHGDCTDEGLSKLLFRAGWTIRTEFKRCFEITGTHSRLAVILHGIRRKWLTLADDIVEDRESVLIGGIDSPVRDAVDFPHSVQEPRQTQTTTGVLNMATRSKAADVTGPTDKPVRKGAKARAGQAKQESVPDTLAANLCVALILHDDAYYLAEAIKSFAGAGPVFAFVSRVPWNSSEGEWEAAGLAAREAGAEVVLGDWSSELEHRQATREHLRSLGFTHALIPDGDEIIEPGLLNSLLSLAEGNLADQVAVHWDTYWHSPEHVIRPREGFTPTILVNLQVCEPVGLRNYSGGRRLVLGPEYGLIHHLSYVGPDSRILRKISTWSHSHELVTDWYDRTWLGWQTNKMMGELHPTHPGAYQSVEHITPPAILAGVVERFRELSAPDAPAQAGGLELVTFADSAALPTVSIVIPLHGGEEDIKQCLESLGNCRDLWTEVHVVDNASPDGAAEAAESFEWAKVQRCDTNLGFAAACNLGAEKSTGDYVLFLNSDTVVPRMGLLRLIESLSASGSIAAAGPYTNRSGHGQQIDPTYTSIENLDLFANDFADQVAEDLDSDMLVGFCLAVRKSVLKELGGFDERFGLGTFEDNDLCHRMRRAGYRLVISARSFVHHHGSKTLGRLGNAGSLLETNHALYQEKWRLDLQTGYASHLVGTSPAPVTFDNSRKPETLLKALKEKARQADISLCMIVKNEERVLGACLESAKPFFREIIVVDTGSTDRTVEIAREGGARVETFEWCDSFSAARNESLNYAKGKWIFWLDADDTLPWASGEAIVESAIHAPQSIAAFVVPVRFTDQGRFGTQVDHVKLFRNKLGFKFEFRIHEQILGSIRRADGQVARCGAVVLHSGYDTSKEGQARKRLRDRKLLRLDYIENPDHPFVLFNIGMTYHFCGMHRRAVKALLRCLRFSKPQESHSKKASALLAVSQRELGRIEEAKQTLKDGLDCTPDDPELLFHSGLIAASQGKPAEAAWYYERLLVREDGTEFTSLDTGILSYKTYYNLGEVWAEQGDYRKARDWWLKALEAAPEAVDAADAWHRCALENGDLAGAREASQRALIAEGKSDRWLRMSTQTADAVGGRRNAEEFLRMEAALQPHDPRILLALGRFLAEEGRRREAEPLLRAVAAQGNPAACHFLGLLMKSAGDLHGAADWLRMANELSPGHRDTLRELQALGVEAEPAMPQITFDAACEQVANSFGLCADDLKAFASEDDIGGYAAGPPSPKSGHWPGGSVWDVEGKLLYSLVRALRPEIIVEVGSAMGCSTSHMARAVSRNGIGKVYAVDPGLDFTHVRPELLEYIEPIRQDALTWTPPGSVGMLFEDGPHTKGFTEAIIERMRPQMAPGAVVVAHDACHWQHGPHISAEVAHGVPDGFGTVLIEPSNCGLGYGRIQQVVMA